METKQCQMIVAENYFAALEKCHLQDDVQITLDILSNMIEQDLNRSCLISFGLQFNDLKNIWRNFQQEDSNRYHQGRIEGSHIPATKMLMIMLPIKSLGLDVKSEHISFTYFDDQDNLCAFTLTVLTNCPAIWAAAVTINTTAPENQRRVSVFMPQFSSSLFEANSSLRSEITDKIDAKNGNEQEFYNQINSTFRIEKAHLFNMRDLNDHLGYAFNNHFIKFSLSNLFDDDGVVQLENFMGLQDAIQCQYSMFDFPKTQLAWIKHRIELNQISAVLTKIQINSGYAISFEEVYELIDKVITDYSDNYVVDNFNNLLNDDIIKGILNYARELKSRDVDHILCSNTLLPFEKQACSSPKRNNLRFSVSIDPNNLLNIMDNNIVWVEKNVRALEKDVKRFTKPADSLIIKWDNANFALDFNQGLRRLMDEMPKESIQLDILARLVNKIKCIANKNTLYIHLDDAIHSLFYSSKNNGLGKNLLQLKKVLTGVDDFSSMFSFV